MPYAGTPDLLEGLHDQPSVYVRAADRSCDTYAVSTKKNDEQSWRSRCCHPVCQWISSIVVSQFVVWSIFVAVVLTKSLEDARREEHHVATCLGHEVSSVLNDIKEGRLKPCSTYQNGAFNSITECRWDDRSNSLKAFCVPYTGIYLVTSRVEFGRFDGESAVFKHRVMCHKNQRTFQLIKDEQYRNCSFAGMTSSGHVSPCHSSSLFSTVRLEKGSIVFVTAESSSSRSSVSHHDVTLSSLNVRLFYPFRQL